VRHFMVFHNDGGQGHVVVVANPLKSAEE